MATSSKSTKVSSRQKIWGGGISRETVSCTVTIAKEREIVVGLNKKITGMNESVHL